MKIGFGWNKKRNIPQRGLLSPVSIIPTYRANNRKYNPFFRRFNRFSSDLKLVDFEFAVNRFQSSNQLKSVRFAGGEVALWEDLEPALVFCAQREIFTILSTNALLPIKRLPNKIIINLGLFFADVGSQDQILKNIEAYYSRRRPKFVYFFSDTDNVDKIIPTVALAKKYKGSVFLAPKFQVEAFGNPQKLEDLWIFAVDHVKKELGHDLPFDHSVAQDLFGSNDKVKLFKNPSPKHDCEHCINRSFVLNPDGKTMFPCPYLEISSDITKFYGGTDMWYDNFLPQMKDLKLEKKSCPARTHLAKK